MKNNVLRGLQSCCYPPTKLTGSTVVGLLRREAPLVTEAFLRDMYHYSVTESNRDLLQTVLRYPMVTKDSALRAANDYVMTCPDDQTWLIDETRRILLPNRTQLRRQVRRSLLQGRLDMAERWTDKNDHATIAALQGIVMDYDGSSWTPEVLRLAGYEELSEDLLLGAES